MNLHPLTGLIYFMDYQILLFDKFYTKVSKIINSHLPLT